MIGAADVLRLRADNRAKRERMFCYGSVVDVQFLIARRKAG
jgi:hypothetical protein